jgi:hypothetical protein
MTHAKALRLCSLRHHVTALSGDGAPAARIGDRARTALNQVAASVAGRAAGDVLLRTGERNTAKHSPRLPHTCPRPRPRRRSGVQYTSFDAMFFRYRRARQRTGTREVRAGSPVHKRRRPGFDVNPGRTGTWRMLLGAHPRRYRVVVGLSATRSLRRGSTYGCTKR